MATDASPSDALRSLVARHARRNAFLNLLRYDRAMARGPFLAILSFLVYLKIQMVVTYTVAFGGWWLDPTTWVREDMSDAYGSSPFHGFPNLYGALFQGLTIGHNLTGMGLFAVCLVPLFSEKGRRTHILFGRAFVLIWLVHLTNGLANSAQILATRGVDATRYLDMVDQGFPFYAFIQFGLLASLIIDFLAQGLASLHYKSQTPSRPMRALLITMPALSLSMGIAMCVWGAWHIASGETGPTPRTTEHAGLFLVQVPAYSYLMIKNIQFWWRGSSAVWVQGWLTEHQRNMMFCVGATLYTGLANGTMKWAPELTPVVFATVDLGFFLWLLTKERNIRKQVSRSRAGLALVTVLSSGRTGIRGPRPLLAAGGADDIARMRTLFGLASGDSLSREAIAELLGEQGVRLTAAELDEIMEALDHNGDGRVDAEELVAFFGPWCLESSHGSDEFAWVFRSLDADDDGFITHEELRTALSEDGRAPLDDAELHAIIDAVDRDSDGRIDRDELARFLCDGPTVEVKALLG